MPNTNLKLRPKSVMHFYDIANYDNMAVVTSRKYILCPLKKPWGQHLHAAPVS